MHVRKHSGERPLIPNLEYGANAALIIESDIPQLTVYLAGFHQGVRPARARAQAQRGAPLRLPALQQGLPLRTPF